MLVVPQQVANGGQVENKMNLPVPVYLRPLDQKDASMKVRKSATRKHVGTGSILYFLLNDE